MGQYNSFHTTLRCPRCGLEADHGFQADIGALEWDDYEVGDQINWVPRVSRRAPIGPDPFSSARSLWATAVGQCSGCRSELIGRAIVRGNCFVGIELPSTPDGLYDWGPLDESHPDRESS